MLLRKDREWLAGVCLGLLFYKPQFLIATIVTIVALRRWRVLPAIATSSAAQLLLAAWYFGPASLATYARSIASLAVDSAVIEPKPYLLHSYRGAFSMLPLTPASAGILSAACSIVLLVFLARSVARRQDVDTAFAMTLPVTVLVGLHASVYDLVLLLPSLAVGLDRLLAAPPESSWRRAGGLLLVSCYLLPAWSTAASWVVVQPMVPLMTALVFWLERSAAVSGTQRTTGSAEPVALLAARLQRAEP
jgi:hypothetical protein